MKKSVRDEAWTTLNEFIYQFTPKWFAVISWLFFMGGLEYLNVTTGNPFIKILSLISYLVFILYLQTVLINFPVYKMLPGKWVESPRFARRFSMFLGALFVVAISLFLQDLVEQFKYGIV